MNNCGVGEADGLKCGTGDPSPTEFIENGDRGVGEACPYGLG